MNPPRHLILSGVPIDAAAAATPDSAAFGTELAPAALRAAGMVSALKATDAGDLPVRLVGRTRDAITGVVGWPSVQAVTRAARRQVREVTSQGSVPVLLGGCCTLLPGALAGARDALGQVGLAYLDGHVDTYDGQTSPTGEPADMPISVIAGHGPAAWSDEVGAPLAGRQQDAAAALAERAGRYWVHVDVDVLSQEIFPATDYFMPGGLDLGELRDLLRPLVSGPSLAGISLGCYNPVKDVGGSGARALVRLLRDALA